MIIYTLLGLNIITFIVYCADKFFAVKKMWRIRERTLLIFSSLFGAMGALFAMILVRHKIRKPKFYITVPVLLLVQAILIYYIVINYPSLFSTEFIHHFLENFS